MQCLKCGNEIADNETFCQSCLASMDAYPVKPGTPVSIPKRPPIAKREPQYKQPRPEEIFEKLQSRVRRLRRIVALLLLLLTVSVGCSIYLFLNRDTGPSIGQNYNTVSDTTPDTTVPSTSTPDPTGTSGAVQ